MRAFLCSTCLLAIACSGGSEPPAPAPASSAAEAAVPAPETAPAVSKKAARSVPPPPPGSCARAGFPLVASAYGPYQAGQAPPPLEEATCWTETVRAQIQAARGRSDGSVLLDFDPLVDAQDAKLSNFRLQPVDADTWQVRFDNLGEAVTVTWELVEEPEAPGNYRVADLHTDGWRLTELLAR